MYRQTHHDEARYLSVALDREVEGSVTLVRVPRVEAQTLTLRDGWTTDQPWRQLLLALGMVALAAAMLGLAVGRAREGLGIGPKTLLAPGLPFTLALWLAYGLLRRGIFLEVRGPRGARKLAFKGAVDPAALAAFVEHASALGYAIEIAPTVRAAMR